jgi:hypothetical protein
MAAGGEVRQWSDMSMPIPVVSRKCTEVELQAYIDMEFVRPFNPLGNEPLFRVEVVETEKSICLLSDGYHAIVDMQAFLDNLSDVYYKLSQNNFFPFASLVQEFNIAPIILFQFFPDWIMEDGKYDDLPRNETLVNKLLSTQKDFMVEALTDVVEMGNSYTFRIFYSGYYSRKMMKVLATTYKETITQMLKS